MDHSAGSYVYDMQGNLRLYSRYGSGATVLAQDIQTLLKTTPHWVVAGKLDIPAYLDLSA
jgi:hypothetical protein